MNHLRDMNAFNDKTSVDTVGSPPILEDSRLDSGVPSFTELHVNQVDLFVKGHVALPAEEVAKAVRRGQLNAIAKMSEQIFQDMIVSGEYSAPPYLSRFMERYSNTLAMSKNTIYSVCVRPRRVDAPDEFIKSMHKYATSKIFESIRYTMETATDDGSCQGLHIHMLCRLAKPTPKSVLRQRLGQAFKRFGDCNIDVQSLTDENKITNTENYIGKLPGEGSTKHADDLIFRTRHSLDAYYVVPSLHDPSQSPPQCGED